jgi:hypothetical protein
MGDYPYTFYQSEPRRDTAFRIASWSERYDGAYNELRPSLQEKDVWHLQKERLALRGYMLWWSVKGSEELVESMLFMEVGQARQMAERMASARGSWARLEIWDRPGVGSGRCDLGKFIEHHGFNPYEKE